MQNWYPQGSRCVVGNDACRPGSLGELASLLGRVEDLVVEDREVERQTEANWMRGLHLGVNL